MTIKREPAIKQTMNKITQNLRQKVILGKKNNPLETIVINFGHSSLTAKPESFVVLLMLYIYIFFLTGITYLFVVYLVIFRSSRDEKQGLTHSRQMFFH